MLGFADSYNNGLFAEGVETGQQHTNFCYLLYIPFKPPFLAQVDCSAKVREDNLAYGILGAFPTLRIDDVALPESHNSALTVLAAPDFTIDEVLIHAASLLNQVTHPCATAVTALARQQRINLLSAAHVDARDEQGWTGRVNGKICVFGTEVLMTQAHIDIEVLAPETRNLRARKHEVYFLSIGDHLAGLLGMPACSQA